MPSSFWNTRYASPNYAYGTAPNQFLQEQLQHVPPGTLLFPCDGEGRNSVYAATLGHTVHAFDISEEGQRKALALAQQQEVAIQYQVADFNAVNYPHNSFDGIGLIYAHFPAKQQQRFHQQLLHWLKPGGTLWIEGFSLAHQAFQAVNPHAGGPKEASMLYTEAQLRQHFSALDLSYLAEIETTLHEGPFHEGRAAVVRLVGSKKTSA